jgi:uncharacterized membrane protein YdbT with pleckstrin-like domain
LYPQPVAYNRLAVAAFKAENGHNLDMSLKNAAFFAVIGMVLLTVLLTVSSIVNVSGVVRGFIPAMALLTSLIQWVASLSVLVFFVVFHRSQ